MSEEELQPPTNIKEMGIHMFYLRRDMSELTKSLAEAVTKFTDNAVPRKEFDDYKIDQALELTEIKKKLEKRPWTALVLGSLFSATLTTVIIYMITNLLSK